MKMDNIKKLEFIKRVLTDTLYNDQIRNDFFQNNEYPDEHTLDKILSTSVDIKRLGGLDWPHRAHTMIGIQRLNNLHYCLDQIRENQINGDLIETGVWRGGASIFMKFYCDLYHMNKNIFVSDSFKGLPPPEISEDKNDNHHTIDYLKVSLETVKENFEMYRCLDQNVIFLEGWFSDTLPNNPDIKNLALLRMDGDMYKSTMDVFESCYDKVVENGYVIIDDYCLPSCKNAVNFYRKKRNIISEINLVDSCGIFWVK